ncbi:hypothetical protein ACFLRW_06695 [Acidobacteriota bacterium]
MKKINILLLIVVLGFACMSTPIKKYHQIFMPVNPDSSSIHIDKSIYIDRIPTQSFYDNFEIIYRDSPYQLNYYAYHYWAEKPGPLIRNSIYEYFKKNRVFSKILIDLSSDNADLTFKARIRAIEEEDHEEAWYARLSMEIEILDFSSGETILFHEFDRKEKMPNMDIVNLPVVLSQILKEELGTVLDVLLREISY